MEIENVRALSKENYKLNLPMQHESSMSKVSPHQYWSSLKLMSKC